MGSDGIVRATPLPGANIFVTAAGDVVLAGTNPGTSTSPPAGVQLAPRRCSAVGPVGLSATLNGLSTFPLTVPDCSAFIPLITTPSTITAPTSSVP